MDLYKELNISKDASQDEIKKAYHKKSKENHPDKKGTTKNMQKINHAYMILKDPEKRKRYDETGDENQINDEKSKIIQGIDSIINAFIENPPDNILYAISEIRSNNEEDRDKQISELQSKKTNIEKFRNRILKTPSDSNDYISNILNNKIGEIDNRIKIIEKQFELFMKALDIFEKYEFNDIEDYKNGMSINIFRNAGSTW